MNIPIIFENPDFLVINKPTGLITHPRSKTDNSPSVTQWLVSKYPQAQNVGDTPELRPGIIHRLDKDTSGLLLLCKTQEAFSYFKKIFQSRQIQKTYLALVYGNVSPTEGTIDMPIGKLGHRQTTRISGNKELVGQESVTDYKTVKKVGDYTLLEVQPKTGRTHQIRVHLNAIHHPIVGDVMYGRKKEAVESRLMLHAWKLEFKSPSGDNLSLEAAPPEDFTRVIDALARQNFSTNQNVDSQDS